MSTFWSSFVKVWATFHSKIWSHKVSLKLANLNEIKCSREKKCNYGITTAV